MLKVRIHGDNIVECERAWSVIKDSLFGSRDIECKTFGSPISPCREAKAEGLEHIQVQLFPGFGRWTPNIIDYIKEKGAMLRETPDAVICILSMNNSKSNIETPIVAIEFCGALSAGNQAWQRCGRAYSFSKAGIPYIYIVEIGGPELDAKRREKATRFPNPVVPFAFILHSLNSAAPTLPILLPSPAITNYNLKNYSGCFGYRELNLVIRNIICQQDPLSAVSSIVAKTLKFVNALSANRGKIDTFVEPIWEQWIKAIKDKENIADFICNKWLPWAKIAYIKGLTSTAKKVIKDASKYAVGVGASNIPICIIPKSKRPAFGKMITSRYTNLTEEFKNWLYRENDLGICWIMGFKPRGDDARPDRGLPPLARMLLGPDIDFMSFIYGPAKKHMWSLFESNPVQLAEQNGLWESIMAMSDAVLIDSSTDRGITKKGYLSSHWKTSSTTPISREMPAVNTWPTLIGENDVDTIIHLLLSSGKNTSIFEGMCNPPGGDWSGISIIDVDRQRLELRWLSLPRVSASASKRPDHVFQFFSEGDSPLVLAIESKENPNSLESKIGNRLNKYVRKLLSSPASAERSTPDDVWRKSNKLIKLSNYRFASAVAFLIQNKRDLDMVKNTTKVDLIFGVELLEKYKSANVFILPCSSKGNELLSIIKATSNVENLSIKIV